jgi:ribonuclease BN (tRNA processing enzyme)
MAMKLKILGTRGEIPQSSAYHSKHSGLLIDGKLLFDLGEKTFLNYKPKAIFLTHLHPDHAYFVRWGKEELPVSQAPIYAPELPKKELIKSCVQILDQKIVFDGYTILPIPTHHSKLVKSQAYLIQKGRRSILYTGDLFWINKEYHHLLENVDLIITEASFMKKGGMLRKDKQTGELFGHNGVPNLINLFKKYTKNILLVHFGSWFVQNARDARKQLSALAKEKEIQIIVGYDGLEIEI